MVDRGMYHGTDHHRLRHGRRRRWTVAIVDRAATRGIQLLKKKKKTLACAIIILVCCCRRPISSSSTTTIFFIGIVSGWTLLTLNGMILPTTKRRRTTTIQRRHRDMDGGSVNDRMKMMATPSSTRTTTSLLVMTMIGNNDNVGRDDTVDNVMKAKRPQVQPKQMTTQSPPPPVRRQQSSSKPQLSLPTRRPVQKRKQRWGQQQDTRDDDGEGEEYADPIVQTNKNDKDNFKISNDQEFNELSSSSTTPCGRKPRYYWEDINNIRIEIIHQWYVALVGNTNNTDATGAASSDDDIPMMMMMTTIRGIVPPIPNDTLLLHWKRHDLRTAIRKYNGGGGRKDTLVKMVQLALTELNAEQSSSGIDIKKKKIIETDDDNNRKLNDITGNVVDSDDDFEESISELLSYDISSLLLSLSTSSSSDDLVSMPLQSISFGEASLSSSSRSPSSSSMSAITISRQLESKIIIPGKWKDAINQFPIVQRVVDTDPELSASRSPTSTQYRARKKKAQQQPQPPQLQPKIGTDQTNNDRLEVLPSGTKTATESQKSYGYWSKEQVLAEFNEYLQQRYKRERLPKIWMPRLSHIDDISLRLTLIKYFGKNKKRNKVIRDTFLDDHNVDIDVDDDDEEDGRTNGDVISAKLGLVPYDEWNYFERQFDLMISLKEFIDEWHDGDYTIFPTGYTNLPSMGYQRLNRLIADFGGRKFVAGRFGMKTTSSSTRNKHNRQSSPSSNSRHINLADLSWGPFDLITGIALLGIVRQQQMSLDPPLPRPTISMPRPNHILRLGKQGRALHNKILKYGGYENVARRLGLDHRQVLAGRPPGASNEDDRFM